MDQRCTSPRDVIRLEKWSFKEVQLPKHLGIGLFMFLCDRSKTWSEKNKCIYQYP